MNYLLLFFLASLWGGSFIFIRIATVEIDPVLIVFVRLGLAYLILHSFVLMKKQSLQIRKNFRHYMFMGLFNQALPYTLITHAVIYLNASISSIINSTTPFFTLIVAGLWLKQEIAPIKIGGIVLGIIGVGILTGYSPVELSFNSLMATAEILLATLCYGLSINYLKLHSARIKPLAISTGNLMFGTIFMMIVLPFSDFPTEISLSTFSSMLGLSILSTAAALIILAYLVEKIGATQASTVTFLIPFFSIVWSVIFLDEPFTVSLFIGFILIISALQLVLNPFKISFR